jgi:hypothetical protein
MQQLGIWEKKHVRRKHHDTELKAAEKVKPKAAGQCAQVYEALKLQWPEGWTDEEGTIATNIYSYRRRRADLLNAGLVEDTGDRRLNIRDNSVIVWRVT